MKKITDTSKAPVFEWLFGNNPGAIENQESAGQKELINSQQLPLKCTSPYGTDAMIQYGKMGIINIGFGKKDELFGSFELPTGWKKESTEHSMWSNLIDDKNRIRAKIFYKAAFYDRKAEISFNKKIHFNVDRVGFLNNDFSKSCEGYNAEKTPFVGRVFDFDNKILFETDTIICEVEFNEPNKKGGYTEKYKLEREEVEKKLRQECFDFLNKNYPAYEDINAYW